MGADARNDAVPLSKRIRASPPEDDDGYWENYSHRLRAALIDIALTKPSRHRWKTQRQGGDPASVESYERVTTCETCGVEMTDDNRDGVCV